MKRLAAILVLALLLTGAVAGSKSVNVYTSYEMSEHRTIEDSLKVFFMLKDGNKTIAANGNYSIDVIADRGNVYARISGSLNSSDFKTNVLRWPTDQLITTTTVKSPEFVVEGSQFVGTHKNLTTDKYEITGHKTPYGSGEVTVIFTTNDNHRYTGKTRIEFRDWITGNYGEENL
jgi:hypothetical protein